MDEIIALERAALERWSKGDPSGYLALYAAELSYFDPYVEARLDGLPAVEALYRMLAGQVRIDKFEMRECRVQEVGGGAVLSFHLFSETDGVVIRWNATEIYRQFDAEWRIVHSHWSLPNRVAG